MNVILATINGLFMLYFAWTAYLIFKDSSIAEVMLGMPNAANIAIGFSMGLSILFCLNTGLALK